MEITEVLDQQTIVTHLATKDKAETLEYMAQMFVKAGNVNDKEQFIKDVYEREAIGATGVGNYIAIPHGKSTAVTKPGVAVAVLNREIEWESLDNTGARIVILFAVGADDEAAMEHLKLLAMFSKRLGDDAVIRRLLEAEGVEDVIHAFSEEEDTTEADKEEELDLDDYDTYESALKQELNRTIAQTKQEQKNPNRKAT